MELNNTVNPKAAIEALFPQSIDCGEGVEVKPFSLATYALLEKLGSYIIFPHEPTQEETLRSFYICTHDPKEVFANLATPRRFSQTWTSWMNWPLTGQASSRRRWSRQSPRQSSSRSM